MREAPVTSVRIATRRGVARLHNGPMPPRLTRRFVVAATAVLAAGPCAVDPGGRAQPSASQDPARLVAATGPALAGCPVFPADNYWNTDIRRLPVNRHSRTWLSHMSSDRDLHPDFGPSSGDGPDYGIPITVVRGDHAKVRVRFRYADESDPVRYPFGADTRVEGGRGSEGDKHAVVVDRSTCRLYETWDTTVADGRWRAGSGATWSLRSNELRPDGWTSGDAAGLPILPGLLRWREVRSGSVTHAVRFTTDLTGPRHVWPARHDAGAGSDYPPMGARFRLRRSFSAAGYSDEARTVIRAFKHYGLVLADNGSPWFFQGEQNAHWPARLVEELKSIPASAFRAVDISGLRISSDSGQAR